MLSLILAALLQSGAPATPDPATPPAPAAAAATVAPVSSEAPMTFGIVEGKRAAKSDRVCFNDPVLGSKIPTRRCMGRGEFEQRQREQRDYVRKVQDDARAPPSR
ncbi:hypothetical protein [Phenylobacterium sp.]|uniref:hypothetical protein n=1 Tax=Phenylobacterium sp. TaxID=1871053 RepID=UPI0025E15230|nr:hypothetical protein [Phenylobacterium sp.]MBX3484239.1 hypothetical protein [Phenylobacterium sp.]MCW5760221.1 hypothetical protein [Phenylobacterium sp.]